jgi:hypothetical protein
MIDVAFFAAKVCGVPDVTMSRHVRFTPESGHELPSLECPLGAKTGNDMPPDTEELISPK